MAPSMRTGKAMAGRGTFAADNISTVPVGEDSVLNEIVCRLHQTYGFYTRPLRPPPTSGSQPTSTTPIDRPWILKLKLLLEVSQDEVDEAIKQLELAAGDIGFWRRRRGQTGNEQRLQLEEAFKEILDERLGELGDRDVSLLPMMGIESASDPRLEVEATPSKNGKGYRHNHRVETPTAVAFSPVQVNGVARSVVASRHNSVGMGAVPGSEDPSLLSKGRGKGGPKDGGGGVMLPAPLAAQRKLKPRENESERPQQQRQRQRQRAEQPQQQKPQVPLKQARGKRKKAQDSVHQTYKEREYNKAHPQSKRQPPPLIEQASCIQSELEANDSDGSFYSAPSSPIAKEKDNSFPGASPSLGSVQQESHFRVSGQRSHERRPVLLGQGKQDVLASIKSTPPRKNSNSDSAEPPMRSSFGPVASSPITSSFGSSSAVKSFTSRGPPSTAATSFSSDVTGWDVPKSTRQIWVRGSGELDPFVLGTSDGEQGLTDLDEPESDRSFDTLQTPVTRSSGGLVNKGHRPANSQSAAGFQRTVLSPVLQSGQGSEASEKEGQELAQLSDFFNDPGLEGLVQEEAEGIEPKVEEKTEEVRSNGNKPKPSAPVPGGDLSDEYDDEVTLDESFEAELVRKYPRLFPSDSDLFN